MREQGRRAVGGELPGALIWFIGIVGRIEWERRNPEREASEDEPPPGLTYELIVDTASAARRPASATTASRRSCGRSTATAGRAPRSGARA